MTELLSLPLAPRDAPGPPGSDVAAMAAALDDLLARRDVRTVFQPIIDLTTGDVVAFEALSRGPAESPLQRPDLMFDTARAQGRVAELDGLCRDRALDAVAASTLASPHTVFFNREPIASSLAPPRTSGLAEFRRRGVRHVIEFTERDLSRDPAALLALATSMRHNGAGIALDDVGVDADSLAFMPFLMPDVIKLDMGLLHRRPDAATAQTLSAVRAHCERRGALILAEGIETPEDERLAVGMGATLGQGWLYGRPTALPGPTAAPPAPRHPLVLRDPEPDLADSTPFAMVTANHPALRTSVELLFALRRQLEEMIATLDGLAVVLLSCVDAPHISCECAEHYAELAAHARFAVALGAGMPEELVPGLRGSQLAPDDPVSGEWDMVVVSPHFAAAIIAKERDDAHPEEGRAFDYVLTYDRTLVVDVARTLMTRALPLEDPDAALDAVRTASTLQSSLTQHQHVDTGPAGK